VVDNKVNSSKVNQVEYNIDICPMNPSMGKYPAKEKERFVLIG
jgi:hypothetical protein